MGKHTPGPWNVDEERATDIVIRNAQRDPVARGYSSGWDKPTARANARLIASAPELLATLKIALASFRQMYQDIERDAVDLEDILNNESYWPLGELRNAIAKAEGNEDKK